MTQKEEVQVEVTNLKKLLPACKRCRIRSTEMLEDKHLPVLCRKCVGVISEYYPHMRPISEAPFEKSRECLFNHERECSCWEEGLTFPEKSE